MDLAAPRAMPVTQATRVHLETQVMLASTVTAVLVGQVVLRVTQETQVIRVQSVTQETLALTVTVEQVVTVVMLVASVTLVTQVNVVDQAVVEAVDLAKSASSLVRTQMLDHQVVAVTSTKDLLAVVQADKDT